MLKITISEITDTNAEGGSREAVVYTQQFKELNVQQLVTSINKTPRVRKRANEKPVRAAAASSS